MVWYIAVSPQKEEKGKPIFFSALSLSIAYASMAITANVYKCVCARILSAAFVIKKNLTDVV